MATERTICYCQGPSTIYVPAGSTASKSAQKGTPFYWWPHCGLPSYGRVPYHEGHFIHLNQTNLIDLTWININVSLKKNVVTKIVESTVWKNIKACHIFALCLERINGLVSVQTFLV